MAAMKEHGILRSARDWDRYNRFTTLASARDDPTRRAVHCPECDQPALIPSDAKGWRKVKCRNNKCSTDSFEAAPLVNDEKSTFWLLHTAFKGGVVDDAGASDDGWRRCPSCSYIISKGDGCDHMTCVCGTEFCWECRAVIGGSGGNHRRNCSHNSD
jgi:hypothetical protein